MGTEDSYAYACQGVFKSSLVTKMYYDKDENKYYSSISGTLQEYSPREIFE